jgi:hypothetical protein
VFAQFQIGAVTLRHGRRRNRPADAESAIVQDHVALVAMIVERALPSRWITLSGIEPSEGVADIGSAIGAEIAVQRGNDTAVVFDRLIERRAHAELGPAIAPVVIENEPDSNLQIGVRNLKRSIADESTSTALTGAMSRDQAECLGGRRSRYAFCLSWRGFHTRYWRQTLLKSRQTALNRVREMPLQRTVQGQVIFDA